MKKYFDLAIDILTYVIDKEVPFKVAVNNFIKKETKLTATDKNDIISLVGCSLRHYYIFSYLINKKYNEIPHEHLYLLFITFANRLFVKKYPDSELVNIVLQRIHLDNIEEFVNGLNDVNKLIPEEINRRSNLYYSLRYNVPTWVVNMIRKQYGLVNLIKFLRTNNINKVNTYRIIRKDDLEGFDYIDDDFVHYVGETKIQYSKAYQNKNVVRLEPFYRNLLNEIDYDPYRGIGFFVGSNNDIIKEMFARTGQSLNFDLLVEGKTVLFNIKKQLEAFKLSGIQLYECAHTSIITCLSNKVHTFFVCPINTELNRLNNEPDYFLRINQNDLDRFIINQIETLENAKEFVELGGQLIYFVPTLSNKETNNVINKFLNDNDDFVLTKAHQSYNFESDLLTGYYAILTRVKEHD